MKFIFILTLILSIVNSKEFSFKNGITEKQILESKEWTQLLYYKDGISEVNESSFFLNKKGKVDPKAELISTLDNYTTNNINDESAICKYPARYSLLSKYVNFKNYEKINKNCEKLNKWEYLKKTDSISLILVSGYVSNPASTFGHSFIKLNTKENDLFSSSVNYGALVPDNENMLLYILKGLTGNYQSGYSDQYFYNQDLTYRDTEFRDMWEYELNLTEEEKDFILLHIWEITAKKYDYYFLNKNCGFRVTEMLNLTTKKDMLDKNDLWFLPIETFQDLESFEKEKIKEVRFIPSNKRVFNAYFNELNKEEKDITKELLKTKFENKEKLNKMEEKSKIKILDFLILYYKQTLVIENNEDLKKIKQKILIERFKYGKSNLKEIKIKEIESPAKNTNPINTEILIGSDKNKEFIGIGFSPYKHTSLGISNLEYDDLIALEGRIGVTEDKIFIDKFDFIKIKKINLDKNNILDEFQYNWNLHIGYENFNDKKKSFIKGGVGYNIYNINNFIIYTFIDSSINDKTYLSIIPNIGIEYEINKIKIKLIQEKEIGLIKEENKDITNFNIQYNINKDYNIGYELKYKEDEYKNLINIKIVF